ncbi:retrovirus-related pol polyprotein from transposon TNT 1-94 [Tanacetum coccineum]
MSSIAKFDVEKFDGSNDFGLWRVKMRCLLIQHGWEAALDPFPETMADAKKTAALKTDVYKKAHSALLLCLDNKVLREVNKENSAAGLKKRTDAKDDGDGLFVRGRSDHRGNQGRGSSRSKSKGKGTYKLKCYICYSEDHLKKDCPKWNKKKSTGFVKKNAGQGSSMHSEGYDNGDLLMAVSEERFLEWIMDSGGSYHMTPRRDFLFDFKEFNGGTVLLGDNRACAIMGTGKVRVQMKDGSSFVLKNVRYIPELKRNLISLGTLDREGHTVKLQNGRVKVIKGSYGYSSGTDKENCVYSWMPGHLVKQACMNRKGEICLGDGKLGLCPFADLWGLLGGIHDVVVGTLIILVCQIRYWARSTGVDGTYLINRVPSYALEKKTPMDLWREAQALSDKCIFLDIMLILGRKLSCGGTSTGSRVEPTMDPHTGENPGNEDEEQDEGPQQNH